MEDAWLILLQPHSELVTREVIGHSEAGEPGDIQIPFEWNNLVQQFHDIFHPPGMPVDRDTVHYIELLPNAEPNYGCQYRMSAAESTEVRR